MTAPAPGDIGRAAELLRGHIVRTPCLPSKTLSAITGAEIWIKFENLQFTSSFKERGALNKLLALQRRGQTPAGVIAASAGNHAQGVAYHARRLGIPATIVMPRRTPFVKIQQTEALGAHVELEGDSFTEASAAAAAWATDRGLVLVHPYDDPDVMAGQGTVALEMLEDAPELDALIVPVGGGGLLTGMAVAAKSVKPDIAVHGVQAAAFPWLQAALTGREAGEFGGDTIAEGIAVKHPSQTAIDVARRLGVTVMVVDEPQIERAIALLLNIEKTVAEGAGAAGLAAVLADSARFAGRKVGLVISGGNIDPRLLASVIMRELVRDERILTIEVMVPDFPGSLARVTTLISAEGGNILEVDHRRLVLRASAKRTALEIMFEARDRAHAQRILAAVAAAGFTPRVVDAAPG
jgi:threonine dehydratase